MKNVRVSHDHKAYRDYAVTKVMMWTLFAVIGIFIIVDIFDKKPDYELPSLLLAFIATLIASVSQLLLGFPNSEQKQILGELRHIRRLLEQQIEHPRQE